MCQDTSSRACPQSPSPQIPSKFLKTLQSTVRFTARIVICAWLYYTKRTAKITYEDCCSDEARLFPNRCERGSSRDLAAQLHQSRHAHASVWDRSEREAVHDPLERFSELLEHIRAVKIPQPSIRSRRSRQQSHHPRRDAREGNCAKDLRILGRPVTCSALAEQSILLVEARVTNTRRV